MPIEVLPLTKAEIPGAIEVIQQAFADDPYFQWVFNKEKFNKIRNYGSLEARCLWGINNAIFHVAVDTGAELDSAAEDKRIVGVSCWLAPHSPSKPESWYSWSQSWLLWFRQGLNNLRHGGRGGLNIRRYYLWKERQAECQKTIWDDERGYYFCNIVAVRPDAQGRGVGRKLFEEVTKIADREGMKCYLESSRLEPNVGIYQRLGFSLKMEMECRDGDGEAEACKLYCMVREPKSSSS
ncbi:acetyltransferase, GNAT family [Aspergillus similis]